jgi:hypothetical protein
MKSFIQFILEGGNITVKHYSTGEDVGSEPINSHQREEVSNDIHNSLKSLDSSFKEKHGHSLFGNALDTGSAYAGSTKHFMNKEISNKEFVQHKPTVGDIDTQIPEQHKDKLEQHLTPGSNFGNMTVIGTKKHGSQISAIMKHNPTGKTHQVDFEPVSYDEKTQEPNELAKFSHSSHWDDVKNGVKGAFHKILLSSTTAAQSKPGIVEDKKGKREIQDIEPYAFSVDKGLRSRHKQIDSISDMPVHKEVAPKDSIYDTDLSSIHKKLFGSHGTDEDKEKISSFSGLADHIRNKIPKEHHEKVVHKFVHSLWNPTRAQAISKNPIEDHEIKQKAVDELKKYFPNEVSKKETEIQGLKDEFYAKKYKSKVGEKINEESTPDNFHITSAMGRFNGPTKEHEKLLDKVFSQPSHKHYVFVLGPKSKEETSDKDPLTADEKVEHLKKLYPEHKDSFIPGTSAHTKTPNQAMAWMYHQHKDHGKDLHLNVVAGSGEEGIKNKSSAGGSSENYKELMNKYNGTRFPERTDEQGNKVGGDYRFNYKSTNVIENPRGTTSGSVVRKFAKENDPQNSEHISKFKELVHSKFSDDHAKELMSQLHNRLNTKTESYIQTFLTKLKLI